MLQEIFNVQINFYAMGKSLSDFHSAWDPELNCFLIEHNAAFLRWAYGDSSRHPDTLTKGHGFYT